MAKTPKKRPTEVTSAPAQINGAVEFIDQNKGTLPEVLTTRDLETLNIALRFLFADLRVASELFQRSESHGRAGAIKALGAAWRLIALFEQPFSENLHLPILHLQDALQKLDQGTVSPMLTKSVRRPGRAASTGVRAALRGQAAGTVTRLMQAGVPQSEAHAEVAKTLVRFGVRPERGTGKITATTVRHWCDGVAADVGRRSEAAIVYDGMFTDGERQRFSALPSDQARRSLAIKSLAGFVLANFSHAHSGSFSELQEPI
jgi:hypothetical protein